MVTEQKIIKLRPHHVEKLLWKSLMWTEGALGAEASDDGYSYAFYENVCNTRQELFNTKCTVELVPALDDLCNACDDKDFIGCKHPDSGESNNFVNEIELQIGHKYANSFLLEKIRGYAKEKHAETGDALMQAKYNFLDSAIKKIWGLQ